MEFGKIHKMKFTENNEIKSISKVINFLAGAFTPRNLLILALAAQIIFFIIFAVLNKATWLRGDNNLYETPAWNLASGNGLTINRNEWEDPYLTELYYKAHPEKNGSDFIPAATFPGGYSYFLAMIYTFAGRSHLAAIIANLALLCATVWLMYSIARRAFGDKVEFYFTMCLVLIFPLWAFWATIIITDTLHLFLLTLFAFAFFVDKPSFRRVLISGIILGLATVVRPYALLIPIALLIGNWMFRCRTFNLKNTLTLTIICSAFLGGWVLNNYYQFEKPIITSKGLGDGLWLSTQKDIFSDHNTWEEMNKRMAQLGITDFHRYHENQILLEDAIRRIKERPFRDALVTVTSMPRLWISTGGTETSVTGKIVLILVFSPLFVLMLVGGFLKRKSQNPIFVGTIVITAYFTLVFAHLNTEGRYIIPARFFSFLLISVALACFLRRYAPRLFSNNANAVK